MFTFSAELRFLFTISNARENSKFIFFDFFFRVMSTLTDIYYGKVDHPWAINIENWQLEAKEQQRINEYKQSLIARLG